jgi:hypothetical protein
MRAALPITLTHTLASKPTTINTPDFSGKDVYQGMLRIPTPLLAVLTRELDIELREWPP